MTQIQGKESILFVLFGGILYFFGGTIFKGRLLLHGPCTLVQFGAVLWASKVLGGGEIVVKVALGGSWQSCTREGGKGGCCHPPFAAKWSNTPATLTFTPFLTC